MMLIIGRPSPVDNAKYLIQYTNKNFCFKSLLELAQLICSCGISKVYKEVKQGNSLKKWIRKHSFWTYEFFSCLFEWAMENIKLKEKTLRDLKQIRSDLFQSVKDKYLPRTAIFRYVKEYEEFTEYSTNVELPIDVAIKEYEKYVEFKKDKWKGE